MSYVSKYFFIHDRCPADNQPKRDLHAANGDWPLAVKLPLVGGHEGAGVIVARGELVQDIEIGDHAGVKVRII